MIKANAILRNERRCIINLLDSPNQSLQNRCTHRSWQSVFHFLKSDFAKITQQWGPTQAQQSGLRGERRHSGMNELSRLRGSE